MGWRIFNNHSVHNLTFTRKYSINYLQQLPRRNKNKAKQLENKRLYTLRCLPWVHWSTRSPGWEEPAGLSCLQQNSVSLLSSALLSVHFPEKWNQKKFLFRNCPTITRYTLRHIKQIPAYNVSTDEILRRYQSNRKSGSCYFRQWPSRRQQKIIFFFSKFSLLITVLFEGTFTSFFKDKKSHRSHKTVGINVFLTIFAWW